MIYRTGGAVTERDFNPTEGMRTKEAAKAVGPDVRYSEQVVNRGRCTRSSGWDLVDRHARRIGSGLRREIAGPARDRPWGAGAREEAGGFRGLTPAPLPRGMGDETAPVQIAGAVLRCRLR
jgi:hypothetical protein